MCCFIGYNYGEKAYKLYDLKEKKIIMSRDVIFYESLFPYKNAKEIVLSENIVLPNILHEYGQDFVVQT